MGAIQSKKKYVILYGSLGCGKTTLLYSQKSTLKFSDSIKPTEGINYEELNIENQIMGIFEVSGDCMQYELVNIISSNVYISGIIYVVPLNQVEKIKDFKDQLALILCNNNIEENNISLIVIYNIKNSDKERLSWLSLDALDECMELKKFKNNYKLKGYFSLIYDCSSNNTNIFDENSLLRKLKNFIDDIFKETLY